MQDDHTGPESEPPRKHREALARLLALPHWGDASAEERLGESEHQRQILLSILEDQQLAERALRRSELRFRRLVENSPYCIHEIDLQGRITSMNAAGLAMMGVNSESEVCGGLYLDGVCEADRDRIGKLMAAAFKGTSAEFEFASPAGRHFASSFVPLHDDDGVITGLMGLSQDITERKRAEAAIHRSEARFRTLAENAPVGIYQTDENGGCVYVNPRWCELTGLTPEQAAGQGWADALHPEDRQRVLSEWNRCARTGEPFALDFRFQTPEGRVIWVASSAEALTDENGRMIGYLGTAADITQRHEAERALRESELRHALAVRVTRDGIWELDVETGMMWWNETYDELFGQRPPDTADSGDWWRAHLHPDDRERVIASLNEFLAGDATTWSCEYRYRRTNGQYADVLDRAHVIRNEDGSARRVIGAMTDITDYRAREREIRASADRLRKLNQRLESIREEERTRIARDLHDELGQLISRLQIDLERAEEQLQQNQPRRVEDTLVAAAELAERARGEIHRIVRQLRPSTLDELDLQSALREECRGFSEYSGVPCEFSVEGDFPELDETTALTIFRLTQELLNNVARHAHATRCQVHLSAGDKFIELSVADNGQGIDFAQLERPDAFGVLGARERAESIGGAFRIESAPEHGTRVIARLPLPKPDTEFAI